jgi:hypothetical protein
MYAGAGSFMLFTITVALCAGGPVAYAQDTNSTGTTVVKKKKVARKPANAVEGVNRFDKNGVPVLPDGSPDYSRFPNPFVVKKWTLELEGTMGTTPQGDGYQEFGLGANAYFYNWLAWRNVAFFRPATQNNGTPIYGIDTTERMSYEFSRATGLAVFGSPGFRLAGGGNAAPLLEGGVTIRIAGLTLGGGARALLHSWVDTAGSNETQFFINLSTGSHP